jgi:hypothetical protein
VTFKDLQKAIQSQAQQVDTNIDLQAKLQGLPFWIFDKEQPLSFTIVRAYCNAAPRNLPNFLLESLSAQL